jgi:xanthine dehydrogenase/oxidase
LERPISSGKQIYPTKEENWPLTKPIPKLESMVQCTGEAKFVSDIEHEGLLHAAFALTMEASATIWKIDTSAALVSEGIFRDVEKYMHFFQSFW